MQNKELLNVIGVLGDGDAVKQILHGTYNFPSGMDEYTKLVLFCSL